MTVTRIQATKAVTASFPNVTATAFTIPRPQTTTPAQVGYAENADHVIEPAARDDYAAGHCTVEMPATLKLATVFCRVLEIRRLLPPAQKGLGGLSSSFPHPPGAAGALFPSGAPASSAHVRYLINETGNTIPVSGDAFMDLVGEVHATSATTVRSYPGITLREGEYVGMTLYNNSGGALNDQIITANYKLGLNQRDTGKP